jgi:hypothetical protein
MDIFVHKHGQQLGPYSVEKLQAAVSDGTFSLEDLCWHAGLEQWCPISSVLAAIAPLSGSPSAYKGKTDPLSIWSLVLGVLSSACLSILAGIPAIICGHLSLRRIKTNPLLHGKGMAIAGLVLGYIQIVVFIVILPALAIPAISGALERGKATQSLSNARQIAIAMQAAALDAVVTGKNITDWPADANLSSVAEVKQMLIANNYLSERDAEKLGFENFLIGNVSEVDPPSTILIKSRSVSSNQIVVRKDGDGAILRPGQTEEGTSPPRNPPFLD